MKKLRKCRVCGIQKDAEKEFIGRITACKKCYYAERKVYNKKRRNKEDDFYKMFIG